MIAQFKGLKGYIEKWSKERQKYDLKFLPFYYVNEKFQSRKFLNYIIFNFSSLEFLVGKIQSVGISIKTFCYPIFIHIPELVLMIFYMLDWFILL